MGDNEYTVRRKSAGSDWAISGDATFIHIRQPGGDGSDGIPVSVPIGSLDKFVCDLRVVEKQLAEDK